MGEVILGYAQGEGPDATAEKNPKTLSKTRATTVYNQLMLMLSNTPAPMD